MPHSEGEWEGVHSGPSLSFLVAKPYMTLSENPCPGLTYAVGPALMAVFIDTLFRDQVMFQEWL